MFSFREGHGFIKIAVSYTPLLVQMHRQSFTDFLKSFHTKDVDSPFIGIEFGAIELEGK